MSSPRIPSTMKGLQITEFNRPYIISGDIPVPELKQDNEVLIKIAVAGYCHTDSMVRNGEFTSRVVKLPLIPSHEGTGTVVAVGPRVSTVKVGDRVAAVLYKDRCGRCNDCKRGLFKYCEHGKSSGITANGAAAEYMVADGDWTIPLPPSIPFECAAPLMCAGATMYEGLKVAGLKPGQTVGIIGAGALGHLGIQFAKCMGLRVVCIDARQAPLDLVKRLKYAPDFAIDATRGVKYALKELGGRGVDATLMATDSIPAHEYGLNLTRKHGTFVIIGQPLVPIPVHYNHLIFRNITIKGSLLSDAKSAREMVEMVAAKGIEVKTRAYPLEDVEILLSEYEKSSHAGKLVFRVSQDI